MRTHPLPLLLVSLALLAGCAATTAPDTLRVATFNIAMGLQQDGELTGRLKAGDDQGLLQVAAILQQLRPDVVLINEFDYAPGNAELLLANYLSAGDHALNYPHFFTAPVNTGVDSGLDIDGNGVTDEPADAWGYGTFPGQYGMLLLSRYPIDQTAARTFRTLRWADLPKPNWPMEPENGVSWYAEDIRQQLRLSSKSHWQVPITIAGHTLLILASHPTPPVFDGPEDRNGARNFDEIRLWRLYLDGMAFTDDQGRHAALPDDTMLILAGDLNADPEDGDSRPGTITQLLDHSRLDTRCIPASDGAVIAANHQGQKNLIHRAPAAHDTSDFNDASVGNLRIDYVLPGRAWTVVGCGVFWPRPGLPQAEWITVSDHRPVWVDLRLPTERR